MKTEDLPDGKYKIILADPAWRVKAYTKERSGTPRRIDGDHYATMDLDALKALPVGQLAAKECALIMWVIDTHLAQALELAAHWGFEYSSIAFVWRKMTKHGKDHFGMGKTTRKQVEIALLFKKSKMPLRQSAAVRQYLESPATEDVEWIDAQVREHSRKPDEIYDRIEALYKGPYCELFARQHRPLWTSWGNEVGKFDRKSTSDIDALLGIAAPKKSTKRGYDDLAGLLG